MLSFYRNLPKQKKQVVILYITTLLGVFWGLLASIVNTRSISPSEYGDVRYVQNVINFICSLLLFGYFLSGSRLLALCKDEYRARTIRGVMMLILIASCILLMLSMLVCFFMHESSRPSVAKLFIVSLPVCFYPLFLNYINTVFQGDNYIGRIALARLVPSAVYVFIAFFVYKLVNATPELMISLQWGIYSLIMLLIIISAKPLTKNVKNVFSEVNKENKEYGIQLYVGSLVMVATNYVAGITLGMFSDNNIEVGFYTLALTVTSPLSMLPSIIGTTYFKQFAFEPKIPSKVLKSTVLLTSFSFILFIIIIKPVVMFMYSSEYAKVGDYAIMLSAGFCIHGFGDMINRYLGSHGQGKSIRNSSIANGIVKLLGFTVLVYYYGTKGALITNVLCSSIYCIVLLYYYKQFITLKSDTTIDANQI